MFAALALLFYLLRCAKQSACCEDVLTAACTNRREHAVVCEIVAEVFNVAVVRAFQIHVGDRVESYEVEAAVESFYELYCYCQPVSK